ncbi:MAG TPA: hypothetical protein ENN80_14475, partial [Candidatus Hydrogenedentes bacterium]|nr:hypothetical protein [Candidatus Hydrogenedentota bacterium]
MYTQLSKHQKLRFARAGRTYPRTLLLAMVPMAMLLTASCGKPGEEGTRPIEAGKARTGTLEQASEPVLLSPPEVAMQWQAIWEYAAADPVRSKQAVTPVGASFVEAQGGLAVRIEAHESHVIFALREKVVDASSCPTVRLRAYGSPSKVGVWWASPKDMKGKEYPFGLDRFAPISDARDGAVEVDLRKYSTWTGDVQVIRFDFYGEEGDTVVLTRLEALVDTGRSKSALRTPPQALGIFAAHPSSVDHGLALLARALVTDEEADLSNALPLAPAVFEQLYQSAPPAACDIVADLGIRLLKHGDVAAAEGALAVAGLRSG